MTRGELLLEEVFCEEELDMADLEDWLECEFEYTKVVYCVRVR